MRFIVNFLKQKSQSFINTQVNTLQIPPMKNNNRMQRIALLLVAFFSVSSLLQAQAPDSGIAGKIVDAGNSQPVEFAQIGLFKINETTPVGGVVTDEEGNFTFNNVAEGTYSLKIQFVGYEVYEVRNIIIGGEQKFARLGVVRLKPSGVQLQEVQVTEQRDVMQSDLGSRQYNVSQDIMNAGGNATDVLRNIPAVQVDENGGLSMRGNGNVTVLINGRQSGLTGLNRQAVLERIPASTIERIEVITNPSAKYDADGGGGIINIILKKNMEDGFNGNVSTNIGNNDRYNGSLDLNLRKGKWNLYSNLNFNQDAREALVTLNRQNFVAGTTPFIDQNRDFYNRRQNYTGTIGAEYSFNKYHTLGFEAVAGLSEGVRSEVLNNRNSDENRNLLNYFLRDTDERNEGNNYNFALNYTRKFDKPRQELKVSTSYTTQNGIENSNFNELGYLADNTVFYTNPVIQRSGNEDQNSLFLAQIDYYHPINDKMKLEAGAKSIFRDVDNDFLLQDFDFGGDFFFDNTGFTNRFQFKEQVHAAYVIFGAQLAKWDFDAGLRAEQTTMESILVTTGQRFNLDYFNLFPSATIAYKMPKNQKIQATYSRRINRPGFRQLNPFASFSNPLVLRSGNPFLRPEFTDSYEIGYLKDWDKGSFTFSPFYKRTTDVVQQLITRTEGDTTVFRPENATVAENYGFEVIGNYRVGKWLSLNGDFSLFGLRVDGSNFDQEQANNIISWNTRMMANFTLPKSWRIQAMVFYRGPTATAQGERKDFFMNSIGVSKSILDNKGTLSLNVRDVAQTMRFGSTVRTQALFNDFTYRGNTRTIMLGFSYRFGNAKQRQRKREGGMDGGFDGGEF